MHTTLDDRSHRLIALGFITAKLVMILPVISRYGVFRDELYYLACADHPALGYVDHPPLSIFILKFFTTILGPELWVIRLPAIIASLLVIMTVLAIARRLGGQHLALILAGIATLLSPVLTATGRFFSMNVFDTLFWSLTGLLLIRIIQEENGKDWLQTGLIIGLGLLNKYSMAFLAIGLIPGFLFSPLRKWLKRPPLWLAIGLALLLFLPHIAWQLQQGWPSLEFMRNAAEHKNVHFTPGAFFMALILENGPALTLIWIPGLIGLIFSPKLKPYRLFGLAYPLLFTLFLVQGGKPYYLSPLMPILLAAGSTVLTESHLLKRSRLARTSLITLILTGGLISLPMALPILSPRQLISYQEKLGLIPQPMERHKTGPLPQHYADMFGWPEFAGLFIEEYGKLQAEERRDCVIFVRNYGQAGAIDHFGAEAGLPKANCGHNSYWSWGPPAQSGEVALIVGDDQDIEKSRQDLKRYYHRVEYRASANHPLAMPYENRVHIFLCRGLKKGKWAELWPRLRHYM